MSTFTPNIDLELQSIGENVDTWGLPLNANFTKIDVAFAVVQQYLSSGIGVVAQVTTVATNNAIAINSAITVAAAAGGGRVVLPSGTYTITSPIILKEKVTLIGQGMGATVIFVDDTSGGTDFITNSPDAGVTWPRLTDVALRDFTITMRGQTVHTAGGQPIRIRFCENVRVVGVESRYSRLFGMTITDCDQVIVTQCKVFRTVGDGIAVWGCSNAIISGNVVIGSNDDAISCHTDNATIATPPPGGIVITGNTIEASQGIKVLGGKFVVISNNVLRRMLSYGIVATGDYPGSPAQGSTPVLAVTIEGNVISDVIFRPETNPRNLLCRYIVVGGPDRQKGTAASVPGWPTGAGGTITPFYVNPSAGPHPKFGIQYINPATVASNYPSPGPSWLTVRGNTCVRTLPAAAAYSDWGYGPLWVGSNGNGTGFYDGPVAEANFAGTGVFISPSIANSTIENNVFDGTLRRGVWIYPDSTVWKNFDVWRLTIRNNKIIGYTDYAIIATQGDGSLQTGIFFDMLIEGNEIDADPRFVSTNRGPNGTWVNFVSPNNLPIGVVVLTATPSLTISRNTFRNMCQPIGGNGVISGPSGNNVIVGNFVGVGGNAGNAGVGTGYASSGAFRAQFEDCNPNSLTFGQRLSVSSPGADSIPTTGYWMRGDFVTNTSVLTQVANRVLSGWRRLTTGGNNVAGTDWVPVYDVTV